MDKFKMKTSRNPTPSYSHQRRNSDQLPLKQASSTNTSQICAKKLKNPVNPVNKSSILTSRPPNYAQSNKRCTKINLDLTKLKNLASYEGKNFSARPLDNKPRISLREKSGDYSSLSSQATERAEIKENIKPLVPLSPAPEVSMIGSNKFLDRLYMFEGKLESFYKHIENKPFT